MASTVRKELRKNCDTRTVGSKGEVTTLAEWRERHGIEPGDQVFVVDEEEGGRLSIIPPESEGRE